MGRQAKRILAAVGLSVLIATGAWGQTATATLSGTVTDSQGAVVPQASLTVTDLATQQIRQTTTGGSGEYTISNLPVSSYRLEASAQGFKKAVYPSITLQVNQTAQLNITLDVGCDHGGSERDLRCAASRHGNIFGRPSR